MANAVGLPVEAGQMTETRGPKKPRSTSSKSRSRKAEPNAQTNTGAPGGGGNHQQQYLRRMTALDEQLNTAIPEYIKANQGQVTIRGTSLFDFYAWVQSCAGTTKQQQTLAAGGGGGAGAAIGTVA